MNPAIVLPDGSLPLSTRAALVPRLRWLRTLIPTLEAACGFAYPRLELVPEAWFRHETPSGWCCIHGRTTFAPDEAGAWSVVVQLPLSILAPSHSEARIIAVLLHEWLHAIRFQIEAAKPDEGRIVDADDAWAQYPTGAAYARLDAALMVDASQWLPEELRRILEWADAGPDRAAEGAALRWCQAHGIPFGWLPSGSVRPDLAVR
jgi:hypothetical protein